MCSDLLCDCAAWDRVLKMFVNLRFLVVDLCLVSLRFDGMTVSAMCRLKTKYSVPIQRVLQQRIKLR